MQWLGTLIREWAQHPRTTCFWCLYRDILYRAVDRDGVRRRRVGALRLRRSPGSQPRKPIAPWRPSSPGPSPTQSRTTAAGRPTPQERSPPPTSTGRPSGTAVTAMEVAERVGAAATKSFPGAYATTNGAGRTGRYNDTPGKGCGRFRVSTTGLQHSCCCATRRPRKPWRGFLLHSALRQVPGGHEWPPGP